MEVSAENDSPLPSNDLKPLSSFYSSYLYNRIRTLLPISFKSRQHIWLLGTRSPEDLPSPPFTSSRCCWFTRSIIREKDAQCMYGLVLYFLDSLNCAVERQAKSTGQWICLRQDIVDLANPGLPTGYKLDNVSQLKGEYDCLLPSSTRQ